MISQGCRRLGCLQFQVESGLSLLSPGLLSSKRLNNAQKFKIAMCQNLSTTIKKPGIELQQSTINTVKATAPLVAENGNVITARFYEIMFEQHPELKSVFNMTHHRAGKNGTKSSQVWKKCQFLLENATLY